MGRSQTINCIGVGPDELIEGKMRHKLYYAMNRIEIAQEIAKARKRGDYIVSWYSQTKTGNRVLGLDPWEYDILTDQINLPKLITCPICHGEGSWSLGGNLQHSCVVCNGSGICKKGNENKWQAWQIDEMKQKYTKHRGTKNV